MLSKEQLQEIIKCKRDPVYFVNNYCYIVHPVRGIIQFLLYKFQHRVLKDLKDKRFNIMLKSRQMGMSTLTASYCLWLGLFHADKNILILSITDRESTRFLDKIKVAFKQLPEWMAGIAVKSNEHTLVLESGSIISSISSSETAGRSEALSLLVIDEGAFIKSIEKIYTSAYPTLSTGGSCIIISTPNGVGNFFHKTWLSAQTKENIFNPILLHWKEHPDRDDAWYEDQKKQLGDPRRVAQELDCEFLASGNTVVSGEMLKMLVEATPYPIKNTFMGIEHLVIYEPPEDSKKYVIGADVATGGNKDYSAFSVICRETGKTVCDYKAKIPIEEFGKILVRIGHYYNTALLGVENNSGYGLLAIRKVLEVGYANIYQTVDVGSGKMRKTAGWCTSSKTRPYMVTELVEAINLYHIGIPNRRFIDELTTFIWNGDKAEAANSYNDDLVMACYSPDTEVLTATGWKNIIDVSAGESIPSLNTQTGKVEMTINTETVILPYTGDMYQFNGRNIDLIVTPNHRMLVSMSAGANKYKDWEIKRADELIGKYFKLKKNADWNDIGDNLKIWRVGDTEYAIAPFLTFLGLYIAEGSINGSNKNKSTRINISQKPYSKGFTIIENILKELNIKFIRNKREDAFEINNTELATYIKQLIPGKCYEKVIPRNIMNLHPNLLQYLLNGLMAGDGWNDKVYNTTSKILADEVVEIVNKLGKSGYMFPVDNIGRITFANRKNKKGEPSQCISKHINYYIIINSKQLTPRFNHHSKNMVTVMPYNGIVTCLALQDNHLMLVRRNGHSVWCGNTAIAWQMRKYAAVDVSQTPIILGSSEVQYNVMEQYKWLLT